MRVGYNKLLRGCLRANKSPANREVGGRSDVILARKIRGDYGSANAIFVTFDVPPGFALDHIAEDGQAATFIGPQDANLVVRGDNVSGGNFKQSVEALMADDEGHGWKLTYRRLTDSWASYSGVKDGMIRYVRAIATCADRVAVFVMDYRQSEKLSYDPIVLRMVKSLDSEGC